MGPAGTGPPSHERVFDLAEGSALLDASSAWSTLARTRFPITERRARQLGATGFVASVRGKAPSGRTPLPSLRMEDGALAMIQLMTGGPLKGRRLPVTKQRVRVGRGEHNDVVIPDESVSGSHATLERRGPRTEEKVCLPHSSVLVPPRLA